MEVCAVEAGIEGSSSSLDALEGMIGCVGSAQFGQEAIDHLNRVMLVQWWTAYEVLGDSGPRLLASGRRESAADCVAQAWSCYLREVHAVDRSFEQALAGSGTARAAVAYKDAREFDKAHRACIYERHGLSGRLSIVAAKSDGGLLAVNLYRETGQTAFRDREKDDLRKIGGLLLACVRRHAVLSQSRASQAESEPAFLHPLARREREVCVRLLRGWTQDGIAADLEISPTTVRTYRDRAFDRLGIASRHQLFAKALAEGQRV